ncbi:MAG: NADH-quinone oxidoreductase subunit L [Firmicutes bacterium]|nr:NADH-quinone oxidoreductase subunit L [Bacillota bacterium]
MEFALDYAWLIVALPLLTSAVIATFAKQLREPRAGYLGTAMMGVTFLLALLVFIGAVRHTGLPAHEPAAEAVGHGAAVAEPAAFGSVPEATPLRHWTLADWAVFAGKPFRMGLMVDNLTAAMLMMVTLVSFCVQLYSIAYMHGDKRFTRYYAAVNLFTAGMLLAVMADNLLLLVVGWELMGLCSYLLIGHWFEQPWPRYGSFKAFITTRTGDTFMLVGIAALYALTGTLNFDELAAVLPQVAQEHPAALLLSALLIFGGPIGKSAQFPLHVWLPDAMAGPTPGSALIHAATMVAVGVYLVARAFAIFVHAGPEVMAVIALVGAFTSLFAASIATLRTDIKQVLAYSTISQLGYMFLALGVGSFSAGTFHLMTHAFFKALLFLAAGSVIHAMHHIQEMHQMGGLRKKIPVTFWTWMVGYLALAGFPFTSGFFSKDELLLAAFNWQAPPGWPEWVSKLPFAMGAATAFLTAYYMTRATYLTFFGEPRSEHAEHAHESPRPMTAALVILAVPALLSGYAWAALVYKFTHAPIFEWWPYFTGNPLQHLPHENAELVTAIATTLGLLGIGLALVIYAVLPVGFRVAAIRTLKPVYVVLKRMYYVDEFYHATAVAGTAALGRLVAWFDRTVVDGIVNLVGEGGRAWADVCAWFDRTFVDGLVNGAGWLALFSGRQLRRLATGQVQSYMMTFAVLVAFGAVAVWLTLSR